MASKQFQIGRYVYMSVYICIVCVYICEAQQQIQCKKVNSCKCMSDHGVIDLSLLDNCAGSSSCTTPK